MLFDGLKNLSASIEPSWTAVQFPVRELTSSTARDVVH
jgi:hypothetical protein